MLQEKETWLASYTFQPWSDVQECSKVFREMLLGLNYLLQGAKYGTKGGWSQARQM